MTFSVMETEETDASGNRVVMYGLQEKGGEAFAAISQERKAVEYMADVLNNEVAPQHQRDILEEMVQRLYMI